MLRADVGVIEGLRFLVGERQNLLHTGRVWNVAGRFLRRTGTHFLLHLHADGFEFQTHALEHVDCHTLPEFDESQ